MVLAFLLGGILVGSISGGFVLWAGGSILAALLCYATLGAIGALGFVYLISKAPGGSPPTPGPDAFANQPTRILRPV